MMRLALRILIVVCLVSIPHRFSFSGQEHVNNKTIVIATGEWAPWTGEDLPHKGFVNHLVGDVFNRAGYEVVFVFYPWPRAYAMVEQGNVDASAYWYESEERRAKIYYSDPLTNEKIVFFHLETFPMKDWADLKDLGEYTIGVSRGNTYTDAFLELGRQGVLTLEEADSDLANLKKLLAGRIDIFPMSKLRGYTILNTYFSKDEIAAIAHHEKPLAEPTGHLIFPRGKKGSLHLKRIFNEHLARLKSENIYSEYLKKLENDTYRR